MWKVAGGHFLFEPRRFCLQCSVCHLAAAELGGTLLSHCIQRVTSLWLFKTKQKWGGKLRFSEEEWHEEEKQDGWLA